MNGQRAKQLRQQAHEHASAYIGQPHHTMTFKGRVIRAIFGKVLRDYDGNERIAFSKLLYGTTIRCNGTRQVYRQLKRQYKRARTPAERRAILNEMS